MRQKQAKEATEKPPMLDREADGRLVFTRGKHQGKPLTGVSTEYLRFVMEHARPTREDGRLLAAEWATREFGRPMTWNEIIAFIKADYEAIVAKAGRNG